MPANQATVIPQLTQQQAAQMGIQNFPIPWSNDTARLPGGNLYSLFASMAANFVVVNAQLVYAFNACRIQTATDTALDNASKDFYGDALPRKPGESDASFRARILAGLLLPCVTRQAFIQQLTLLLGAPPRLIDPWNPGETASYDFSYYDVDLWPDMPGIYGAPGLDMQYQVGLQAVLPPVILQTYGVLYGFDYGSAYDYGSATFSPATASQFFSPNEVDELIIRIKAAGITVWRKYLSAPLITYAIANTYLIGGGTFSQEEGTLPQAGPYWAIISGSWNSNYYVSSITPSNFVWNTSSPAPSGGGQINTLTVPFTEPNSGFENLPTGTTSITIPAPASNPLARLALTLSWPANYWISSVSGGNVVVQFNSASPPGATIGYVFMPDTQSQLIYVPTGSLTMPPLACPNAPGAPFVTPSWNTQTGVIMSGGNIQASFSVPAPSGAFVHCGYFLS